MRITRAGLIAVMFLGVFAAVRPNAAAPARHDVTALPLELGEFASPSPSIAAADAVATIGADAYIYRIYAGPAATVEMDLAYYRDPRVGRVMHSPLNCLPGTGWKISGTRSLTIPGGYDVRTLIAERGETRLALMYWYQTPRSVTGSELRSRLNLLTDGLATGRRDATLVRLVTPFTGSPEAGTATLQHFATQLIPQIATRFAAES